MKLISIILCVISSYNICAQNNHPVIEIDHFGNIYTVDGNEFKKYALDKKLLSNFSDALLGEITSIDVSNPLRILLFYKEFNQLLYLDQTLTPITDPIDLYTYTDNETQLCCDASSGGFWIYNNDDSQAFQISKRGEILNKSSLLTSYLKDSTPSKIIEYQENLYFLIPSEGLLVLNKFGHFIQQIPISGIRDFYFNKQNLLYLKNVSWFIYNPLNKIDLSIFEMKNSSKCQGNIYNDRIYIYCGDNITIKKLNP